MATRIASANGYPKAAKASKDATKKTSQEVTTKGIDQEVIATANPPAVEVPKFNIKALDLSTAMARIAGIAKSGKALHIDMHEVLCGIALHYADHGDYTALQQTRDASNKPTGPERLLEITSSAVSRGLANAMILWLSKYTSLRYNDETKRIYHNKRDKRIGSAKGFVDMAGLDVPFWTLEPEPVYKPVDFNKLFADFLNRATRLLKEKTEGKELDGGKVKKIAHEHIDDKLVADLTAFGKQHKLIEMSNVVGNA